MPLTPEDQTAIQKIVADAIKPVTTQVEGFAEQIKALPDLQTQVKTLVEADSARAITDPKDNKGKGAATTTGGEALTAESVSKLVNEGIAAALKTRDETSAASAAQQAAIDAYIEKNAPKHKDNPLFKRLFAGTKTDDERKVILGEYVESVKASGAKAPDLGATPPPTPESQAAAAEAKKAEALEAAGKLQSTSL